MTKAKNKPKYKPPTYQLKVNSLVDFEAEASELFNDILTDYCNRFNVKVTDDRIKCKIMLSAVQGGSNVMDIDGLCAFEQINKLNVIAIQVRCMILEDMDPNEYTIQQWLEVMTHEFVHTCQCLTGREMPKIKHIPQEVESESYYFDPDEVEARILQAFYANKINPEAAGAIVQKIRDCMEDTEEEELLQLVELN